MRKRDKLYIKLKLNRTSNSIKNKFTILQLKIQNEIRTAYNDYLQSLITDQSPNSEEPGRPNKRIWTLIKPQ